MWIMWIKNHLLMIDYDSNVIFNDMKIFKWFWSNLLLLLFNWNVKINESNLNISSSNLLYICNQFHYEIN
jgi:hypothetical protein